MTVPTNKKLNNKGTTLIEVIIVVAIMTVMISGAIIAFTVLHSGNVKNASRTSKSLLEKTRTSTMSVVAEEWAFVIEKKEESHMAYITKVYKDEEGNKQTEKQEETDIGERVSTTVIVDGTETKLNNNDVLKVKFDPSSGSVSSVEINGGSITSTDNTVIFRFTSGSNDNDVKIYFLSGKAEIE